MILVTVGSRIMAPQKYIHPNTCNLGICYCIGKGEFKVEDVVKDANQLTLTKAGYSGFSGGSNVNTNLIKSGRGR